MPLPRSIPAHHPHFPLCLPPCPFLPSLLPLSHAAPPPLPASPSPSNHHGLPPSLSRCPPPTDPAALRSCLPLIVSLPVSVDTSLSNIELHCSDTVMSVSSPQINARLRHSEASTCAGNIVLTSAAPASANVPQNPGWPAAALHEKDVQKGDAAYVRQDNFLLQGDRYRVRKRERACNRQRGRRESGNNW